MRLGCCRYARRANQAPNEIWRDGRGEFGAAAAAAEKINAFTVTVNINRPRPKDKAVDPLDMVDFKASN